ncbi:MAG: hypothetical protein ACP5VE_03825 [Chthonomonadales bacterium]
MTSLFALLILSAGLQPHQASPGLIPNSGFELVEGALAAGWAPFEHGYVLDSEVKHGGAHAIRCSNSSASAGSGASVTLVLNQTRPTPIVVTGWSKAQDVSGTANSDYSIYVDLEYQDGTPLWGQVAPFHTGTHDWQRAQVLIVPAKPVKSARVYALFRNHVGTVWFDDFQASQIAGSGIFDGQPIHAPALPANAEWGWFARDVANDSSVAPICVGRRGSGVRSLRELRTLGLAIVGLSHTGALSTLRVADTTGRTRALTLYYVERAHIAKPVWWNDLRSSVPADAPGDYWNLVRVGNTGAIGMQSLYPFACISNTRSGVMIGIPPDLGPRIYRLGYHAPSGIIFAAFDVALTKENLANRDPSGRAAASVAVMRSRIPGVWGFRAAIEAYVHRFPWAFQRRTQASGLWIPFTKPESVERLQDFHFAFHEGDNSVASDRRFHILSFRYTEPMTWWMAMDPSIPRTYEEAIKIAQQHLNGPNQELRHWAQALWNSGTMDESGRFNVQFANTPWTNGAIWVLNPNPRLPHLPDQWTKARLSYDPAAPITPLTPDGEYLDSLEGWAEILDYAPRSIAYSQAPPTFTSDTHSAVIPTWFSVWELAAFMSRDLHNRGRLLMANGTPWRFSVFMPLLDVAGTETNWMPGGKWQPDSDAIFNLRRTMSYHKPYLLLQNTDFDRFDHTRVEQYFNRCLFYAVFPSMFSADASTHPYWEEPKWYNRDRDLFAKYIPAIQELDKAGWEPITHASSSDANVYMERYGQGYFAALNTSSAPASPRITIHLAALTHKRRSVWALVDLITGTRIPLTVSGNAAHCSIQLAGGEARAFRLEPSITAMGPRKSHSAAADRTFAHTSSRRYLQGSEEAELHHPY